MKVTLKADKVKITGPKVDGGFSVTLEVGEYEQAEVAKLLAIPQNVVINVQIEAVGES